MTESSLTGRVMVDTRESTLVARAQVGDRDAFEALVIPRLDRLLRLAMSILSNDADASDAVQEACLRAWREVPRLREPDRFEAWLWRIAINGCRSSLQSRHRTAVREVQATDTESGDDAPSRDRPLGEALSEADVIARAFRQLDPDKRTILVLHHVEDRSIVDIAGLLSIPEGTAKWRLHAARKALQHALGVERR